MNAAILAAVAQGQQERTLFESSKQGYISKMRTMTKILNGIVDVRENALVINEENNAVEHIGSAHGVYRLILPISVNNAQLLFAALSIDPPMQKCQPRVFQGS